MSSIEKYFCKLRKYFFLLFKNKCLILRIIILSAFFRFIIFFLPFKFTKKFLGEEKCETSYKALRKHYKESKKISKLVYKVNERVPWESKCLVTALVIKQLLKYRNISSTIYLGVYKNKNSMEAHAWLRVGDYIISGKEEKDRFIEVAKFA